MALAEGRKLSSYGVSNGDLLELLVVDMEWSDSSQDVIDLIKNGGEFVRFENDHKSRVMDYVKWLALSWAIVNAVCLS